MGNKCIYEELFRVIVVTARVDRTRAGQDTVSHLKNHPEPDQKNTLQDDKQNNEYDVRRRRKDVPRYQIDRRMVRDKTRCIINTRLHNNHVSNMARKGPR